MAVNVFVLFFGQQKLTYPIVSLMIVSTVVLWKQEFMENSYWNRKIMEKSDLSKGISSKLAAIFLVLHTTWTNIYVKQVRNTNPNILEVESLFFTPTTELLIKILIYLIAENQHESFYLTSILSIAKLILHFVLINNMNQ